MSFWHATKSVSALIVIAWTTASAAGAVEDQVLFHLRPGLVIRDSQFGPIAQFQAGLLAATRQCNISRTLAVNGKLDRRTLGFLQALLKCDTFSGFASTPVGEGAVTVALWTRVTPTPPPDARQRAHIMTGANENTDYTDIEFNVGTSDPGILTWGPLGATAGQAFQVQRILQLIDQAQPDLITHAFGPESDSLRAFMKTRSEPEAKRMVTTVKDSELRKTLWKKGFAALGSNSDVRASYDRIMGSPGTAGEPEAVADFFHSYWDHCWRPTEVDFGFFLDRAVQMDVRRAKTDAALTAVAAAENKSGRQFSPAERRRAIAANFVAGNPHWVGDRLARDVAFFIDAIPQAALTDESLLQLRQAPGRPPAQLNSEYNRWLKRFGDAGMRASDYGLSDQHDAVVPADLAGKEPACLR